MPIICSEWMSLGLALRAAVEFIGGFLGLVVRHEIFARRDVGRPVAAVDHVVRAHEDIQDRFVECADCCGISRFSDAQRSIARPMSVTFSALSNGPSARASASVRENPAACRRTSQRRPSRVVDVADLFADLAELIMPGDRIARVCRRCSLQQRDRVIGLPHLTPAPPPGELESPALGDLFIAKGPRAPLPSGLSRQRSGL